MNESAEGEADGQRRGGGRTPAPLLPPLQCWPGCWVRGGQTDGQAGRQGAERAVLTPVQL